MEIWKAIVGQGAAPAFQLRSQQHPLQASCAYRGNWRGQWQALSPTPTQGLSGHSVPCWLSPGFSSQEGGRRGESLVQMFSLPSAPTGPELGEFQQVWGALSCQMLAELLNC